MTDSYEQQLVGAWRGKGRSWFTIAENLRRPVEDVRRRYDHGFSAARSSRPQEVAISPRCKDEDLQRKHELAVLKRLYLDGGHTKVADFPSAERAALVRLKGRHGFSIVSFKPRYGTALTDVGRALFEKMAQVRQ